MNPRKEKVTSPRYSYGTGARYRPSVLEREELRQLLQQAVADLPLIYREIFLLRDVEDLSVNESADVLGITVASAKVRLHRARIMLQKKLVPQLKKANPKRRWFSWS